MYVPDHFAETDPAAIAGIMEGAPLACVVGHTPDGLIANHLPLLAAPDGTLIGHVALANDMHRRLSDGQQVLAIFRGDDAYVSPNWYPGKQVTHRAVPTWNYEVVHVHGTITFEHDVARKRAAVGLLTRLHERRVNGAAAWRMRDAPADYMDGMLAAIVAFRVTAERVLAKSKLSQNRDAADHAGAMDGLRTTGHARMADRMARRP
ncbi:transcriptional regulator [Meridianimarinicoccus roseus]|uniref:Transcriptional regulator n=1 Tax=Meridianimarinicoccus roseus TaxID=2072018 RepID=A0A2V2LLG0_9RHOB|nr:FMN-binding negative transcriptional regulator [Meridianimarinicoccus roseus]PWR03897.1 transcriptional regulator [Meridianimarinicoccus roseus]